MKVDGWRSGSSKVRDCGINPPGVGSELGMTRCQPERTSSISLNHAVQKSPQLRQKMKCSTSWHLDVCPRAGIDNLSTVAKRK